MNKGLYVHIPFCKVFCNYCDFCRYSNYNIVGKQYLKTLTKEFKDIKVDKFSSIYIGGGTPSSLPLDDLDYVLSMLENMCQHEYTIECNVEDVSFDLIQLLKSRGINRISLGVQSFNNNLLKVMNRTYDSMIADYAIKLVKENFDNYSVDLIYGLPNQTISDFKRDLEKLIYYKVPHISLYGLTIEKDSIWGIKKIPQPDEILMADFYDTAVSMLSDYQHYEISNFCLVGYQANHNLLYWKYSDYYGIGLSASGKIGNYRYTNTFNIQEYFTDYKNKSEELYLDLNDQMFEYLMMNLRLEIGVDLNVFFDKYQVLFLDHYHEAIKKNQKYLNIYNETISIKKDYWYISNKILLDFL